MNRFNNLKAGIKILLSRLAIKKRFVERRKIREIADTESDTSNAIRSSDDIDKTMHNEGFEEL